MNYIINFFVYVLIPAYIYIYIVLNSFLRFFSFLLLKAFSCRDTLFFFFSSILYFVFLLFFPSFPSFYLSVYIHIFFFSWTFTVLALQP